MQAEDDQRAVESVLEGKKAPVGEKTTFEEYEALLDGEKSVEKIDGATRRYIFEKVGPGACAIGCDRFCR